jgi:hypothetical protein
MIFFKIYVKQLLNECDEFDIKAYMSALRFYSYIYKKYLYV